MVARIAQPQLSRQQSGELQKIRLLAKQTAEGELRGLSFYLNRTRLEVTGIAGASVGPPYVQGLLAMVTSYVVRASCWQKYYVYWAVTGMYDRRPVTGSHTTGRPAVSTIPVA